MWKTLDRSDAEDLEWVDVGKRARVLVEGLEGMEVLNSGSTERTERTERTKT